MRRYTKSEDNGCRYSNVPINSGNVGMLAAEKCAGISTLLRSYVFSWNGSFDYRQQFLRTRSINLSTPSAAAIRNRTAADGVT
jgi:hypothetical protein